MIRILLAAALLPPAALLLARASRPSDRLDHLRGGARARDRGAGTDTRRTATPSRRSRRVSGRVGWANGRRRPIILVPALPCCCSPTGGRRPALAPVPLVRHRVGGRCSRSTARSAPARTSGSRETRSCRMRRRSRRRSIRSRLAAPRCRGRSPARSRLVRRPRRRPARSADQLRLLRAAALVVAVAFVACFVGSLLAPAAFDVGAVRRACSRWAASPRRWRSRSCATGCTASTCTSTARSCYSGLTVVLGGLYVAAVLVAGALLGQQTSSSASRSPATALVAVVFHPLRETAAARRQPPAATASATSPYAAISTLGRRLGEAIGAVATCCPVMAETIAERAARARTSRSSSPTRRRARRPRYGSPGRRDRAAVAAGSRAASASGRSWSARARTASRSARPTAACSRTSPAAASAAASAVALSGEVQHSRERLVTAREEERRRLRGDLHDGLGPTLAGAVLTIEAARRLLARDPAGGRAARPGRREPRGHRRRRPPPRLRAAAARARPARPGRGARASRRRRCAARCPA